MRHFDYLRHEYSRKKTPVLTEKSILGFTEEELIQRKKALEEKDLWVGWTKADYVYRCFVGQYLEYLNPREEKGVYISFKLKDYIDWIKINLMDLEEFRLRLDSFISENQRESPFISTYEELLIRWINEGLEVLKNKKIILDFYVACECNDYPNNHVIFLT